MATQAEINAEKLAAVRKRLDHAHRALEYDHGVNPLADVLGNIALAVEGLYDVACQQAGVSPAAPVELTLSDRSDYRDAQRDWQERHG